MSFILHMTIQLYDEDITIANQIVSSWTTDYLGSSSPICKYPKPNALFLQYSHINLASVCWNTKFRFGQDNRLKMRHWKCLVPICSWLLRKQCIGLQILNSIVETITMYCTKPLKTNSWWYKYLLEGLSLMQQHCSWDNGYLNQVLGVCLYCRRATSKPQLSHKTNFFSLYATPRYCPGDILYSKYFSQGKFLLNHNPLY